MDKGKAIGLSIRYVLMLLFTLFYGHMSSILFPMTLHSSYLIINLFYDASIQGSSIFFNSHQIELIGPCMAVLAYLLLIVLNLSVPMKPIARLKSLSFSLIAFFIFNLLRIAFLSIIFGLDLSFFSSMHLFFWYFMNILAVVIIWMIGIRTFKIKGIPLISDIRNLAKKTRK